MNRNSIWLPLVLLFSIENKDKTALHYHPIPHLNVKSARALSVFGSRKSECGSGNLDIEIQVMVALQIGYYT